jgi:hypothetical protein
MTNKQFEQTCKQLFLRLNETMQQEVRQQYAQEELQFSEAKATEFAFQTLKKEKNWPKTYQPYATPQAKNKMYLWHYINCVLQDWKITHHEIVAYITSSIQKEESGLIKSMYNDPNHPCTLRLWELASEWADKFTETYIGHDWRKHADYYEKIEDFCNEENQKLDEYAHL